MKFIFDFDDVLFNTTDELIKHIYAVLKKEGVPHNSAKKYLEREVLNRFSLKKMLVYFSVSPKLYERILKESKKFVNKELLKIIKKLGKVNCYIITYGDEEFQLDKIKRTNTNSLFSEIIVVSVDEKKELIEKICAKHKNEKVVFIDDKPKHFVDLDFKKCPNLKTILFDERGLEKFISILPQS